MKQSSNIILYILIGLLLASGLFIMAFRSQLFGYLRGGIGLTEVATSSVTVSPRDAIDPQILEAKRFATLQNYVVNFDFDNICWRPDSTKSVPATPIAEDIATGTATTTVEAAQSVNCRLGNDLPFMLKKKK